MLVQREAEGGHFFMAGPMDEQGSKPNLISKMIQPAQAVAHSVSQCPEKMEPPKPEVSHGAEQSAVPEWGSPEI
jgi:hypothetical protein